MKNNVINFPENTNIQNQNINTLNENYNELPENSCENSSSDLTFKIENFEGPLDLLLHLIKKNKMEIEDVKLSSITEQYLEIMCQIDKIDMDSASEFIEIAATLIEIKSKAMLPKIDEEEQVDEEELLRQRLSEYKLFKEFSEKLHNIENVERFYKQPEPDASKFRIVIKDMQLEMLLEAFTRVLHRVIEDEKKASPKEVVKEIYTVTDKIAAIKDALLIKNVIKFSQLFLDSSSRNEVVTTFLAILELLKLQEIKCNQNGDFNDIEIYKAEK